MTANENDRKIYLTKEWVGLVKEAMRSNITKEDFKQFLKQEKKRREKDIDNI